MVEIFERPESISIGQINELMLKAFAGNENKGLIQESVHEGAEKLEQELLTARCLVAVENDRLVGTYSLDVRTLHHWPNKGKAMYLHSLAVDPEYQGNHIADRLLENHISYMKKCAAEERERGREAHFCYTVTGEKNIAARKLFEKHGFIPVWFSTYSTNNFYSVMYGKWINECPYSPISICIRYHFIKMLVKALYLPGRRFRFLLWKQNSKEKSC